MGLLDPPGYSRPAMDVRLTKLGYGAAKAGRYAVSGGPNTNNTSVGNITFRPSVILPVSTTRWRFNWRNFNITANAPAPSTATSLTLTGVYIGQQALDTEGARTGNFTAAPLQAVASTVLNPTDGALFTSGWITDPAKQFTKGTLHCLSIGLIANAGFSWSRAQTNVQYKAGAAATDVSAQTITIAGMSAMYGDCWIEYEFDGALPIGLHIGDSLTDGQMSSYGLGQGDNFTNVHSVRQSIAAASLAVSGFTLSSMAVLANNSHFWTKYGLGAGWVPNYALVWAMTNDIAADRTEAQIKADFATVVGKLRSFGITNIYTATVLPRTFTAPRETVRNNINTWLKTRPFGVLGVFDFASAVTDPADSTKLAAAYDSGDTTHLNVAGYARLAEMLPGRLGV